MDKRVRARMRLVETATVSIDTPGGAMGVYEAKPDGPPRGGVIVIQEAFGVNAHIEDVARRFANEGWHALAPHLFHRAGDPVVPYGDMAAAMEHTRALTGDGLLTDADACLAHFEANGIAARRVAVVGFCMGGTATFFLAVSRPLGAAATFYGGGITESRWPGVTAPVEAARDLQTPWLGLFGDLDQGIPVEAVERLREAVSAAGVATEVVRYADAGHGFHCDARPQSYHEASAKDAWSRTLAWFDTHVPRS